MAISVFVACAWANGLLHVSQRAADLVVDAEDLRDFVPRDTESEASQQDRTETDQNEASDEMPVASKGDAGNSVLDPADETDSTTAASEERSPLEDAVTQRTADQKKQELVASVRASDMNPQPVEQGETDDEPLTPGIGGNLATFSGQGVNSDGSDGEHRNTGRGAAPVWDVHFAKRPTLEEIQGISGAKLAGVRQRRGYVEIAILQGRSVLAVTTVEQFLRDHPDYHGRRGIVLDRSWLRAFEERLITYGGGWEMWLLIEDQTFNRWADHVRETLVQRHVAMEDVSRIGVCIFLDRQQGMLWPRLAIDSLDVIKPDSAGHTGENPDLAVSNLSQGE